MKIGLIDNKKTYTPPNTFIVPMEVLGGIMAESGFDYNPGDSTEEALSNGSSWDWEPKRGLWDEDE